MPTNLILILWVGISPPFVQDSPKNVDQYTSAEAGAVRCAYEFPMMGVKFRIVAYCDRQEDFEAAMAELKDGMQRLDAAFSNYKRESEAMQLCESAPHEQPVEVSPNLYRLCVLCDELHRQSNGRFDASLGALTELWRMARKRNRLPRPAAIERALLKSGWSRCVKLQDENRLQILVAGCKLDFGGIAKGFAADEGLAVLARHDIRAALVDAGGDIACGEAPPGELGWIVEIQPSRYSEIPIQLCVQKSGVASSGDAEQRLLKNGIRYSHILDPKTGQALTDSASVTVIAPNATRADAWASAISAMGAKEVKSILAQFKEVQYRVEPASSGTGEPTPTSSSRFDQYLKMGPRE
jgi:thiamine biosynthesis lipoprotein